MKCWLQPYYFNRGIQILFDFHCHFVMNVLVIGFYFL